MKMVATRAADAADLWEGAAAGGSVVELADAQLWLVYMRPEPSVPGCGMRHATPAGPLLSCGARSLHRAKA
jgi:hypothetical protein